MVAINQVGRGSGLQVQLSPEFVSHWTTNSSTSHILIIFSTKPRQVNDIHSIARTEKEFPYWMFSDLAVDPALDFL